jgi:hypothetical protein
MKTTLLAFLCIALFSCLETSAQPCDLASVYFERVYTGTDGKCYADVYFDMDRNNGNKFIYLHFWTKANFNKVSKARFLMVPDQKMKTSTERQPICTRRWLPLPSTTKITPRRFGMLTTIAPMHRCRW